MVTGVHGTDVEEGLEEALQSLTLGHVPQVRSHDRYANTCQSMFCFVFSGKRLGNFRQYSENSD